MKVKCKECKAEMEYPFKKCQECGWVPKGKYADLAKKFAKKYEEEHHIKPKKKAKVSSAKKSPVKKGKKPKKKAKVELEEERPRKKSKKKKAKVELEEERPRKKSKKKKPCFRRR
ncbi:hypothetical protein B6U90_03005 [Thermoplasmatales archaeon ex4484_6]|nr:MAG: hypothetical protein B6U90_03005 [Thermoplasmatales archaeon ex4484_6]